MPDCADKQMHFSPTNDGSCLASGYEAIADVVCPKYSVIEYCAENPSYIKCNNSQWCLNNDYDVTECNIPEYLSEQCPNGETLYKACVEDFARACSALSSDYVLECAEGYAHDENEVCPYSDEYAKCCNTCVGYDYLHGEWGQGYLEGASCNDVVKYKRVINPCTGYQHCSEGGKTGASICWHGEEKWYSECCSTCDAYPYSIDTIPIGYVAGDSCDSCSGMTYKTAEGRCATGYEWSNGACVESCSVGNILYSDMTCNSCVLSGKTAIGVVVKDNELVASLDIQYQKWSADVANIAGIEETADTSVVQTDMDGKRNTLAIVDYYGAGVDVSSNAGAYCYNYAPEGMESTKNQWYLPAAGEVYDYIYTNYAKVKAGWDKVGTTISDRYFWSSSEYSVGTVWYVGTINDFVNGHRKDYSSSVSCFLDI